MKNLALGIDPGIGNTGWAFVKRTSVGYQLITSGYTETSKSLSLGERLDTQYCRIHSLLFGNRPGVCAIESAFFNKNVSSHNKTVSVIAIAELAAVRCEVPTLQIKPQFVKSAVGCQMNASKAQILKMVNKVLKTDITNHHEADACAVAIAALLRGVDR